MCSSFVFKASFLWYFIQFSTLKLLFLYEHIKCTNLLVEIEWSVIRMWNVHVQKVNLMFFFHSFSLSSVLLQTFCTFYQFYGINAFKSIIFITLIYQMECIYSQLKIWLSLMIISNEHCLQRFLLIWAMQKYLRNVISHSFSFCFILFLTLSFFLKTENSFELFPHFPFS